MITYLYAWRKMENQKKNASYKSIFRWYGLHENRKIFRNISQHWFHVFLPVFSSIETWTNSKYCLFFATSFSPKTVFNSSNNYKALTEKIGTENRYYIELVNTGNIDALLLRREISYELFMEKNERLPELLEELKTVLGEKEVAKNRQY